MENLKRLVYGFELSAYQKKLAQSEFEKLKLSNEQANEFIINIAEMLNMDVDGIGFDGLQFSINDFKDAINKAPVCFVNEKL